MNLIWTTLVVAALAAMCFVNPSSALTVCVDSATQALTTAFSLAAVYCLWTGVFNVLEQSRLVEKLAKLLKRVTTPLFGKISDVAAGYVALNMSANMLGVGNAATPSAVKAIRETEHGEKLSRAGAVLFVINATSIQLVPTTVMSLRASFGSANPSDIMLPTLLSTLVTSALGVALVFLAYGRAK